MSGKAGSLSIPLLILVFYLHLITMFPTGIQRVNADFLNHHHAFVSQEEQKDPVTNKHEPVDMINNGSAKNSETTTSGRSVLVKRSVKDDEDQQVYQVRKEGENEPGMIVTV
jgi:hypothetical protein